MNLKKSPQINRLLGFTLVEIMVALAISSILLLGVVEIFSTSKRSHKVNEALARVQENARFAMESLLTDLRKAGYVGCSPNVNNFVNDSGENADLFNITNATGGWEYVGADTFPGGAAYDIDSPINASAVITEWNSKASGDLPAGLAGRVVAGTDVIVLKWVEPIPGVHATNTNIKSVKIGTTVPHGIAAGTLVVIGDCRQADAFLTVATADKVLNRGQANGKVPPGNTDASADWSKSWGVNAQLMAGFSQVYFVGIGAGGGPALFTASYQDGTDAISYSEIAEGIENMQILYGADTSGDGVLDSYQTAENVSHAQVVSVKVGIVARSEDEPRKTANSRALDVLGIDVNTPADRHLRYVFTSTVKIRNKGAR